MQDIVLNEAKLIIDDLQDKRASTLFNELAIGKMLRAKLIFEIAGKKAAKLAAIVELIHLASLLHDDVIDHSSVRRGKPTTSFLYGEHTAIMLGDILYSKAFYELCDFDPKIAKQISLAVSRLSIGELNDVADSTSFNDNEEVYLKVVYDKTASLIEASCYGAAIIADLEPHTFAQYGKSLGIAFQLIDDLLDIFADEKTLGKPVLNDFVEGKSTTAYIKLYHLMNKDEKQKLTQMFKCKLDEKKKEWLFGMFAKYDIKTICEKEAYKVMQNGIDAIMATKVDESLKIRLKEIAIKQLGRTF